ncbi:MAG: uracil permease [Clostridia bacterium]|nr:uracil permease [Clostridia bacterium]
MKKLNYSLKDAVLSFQHMFAMLGATILVPILANMSIPAALLSAGFGTIAFYFITQKKVPVFLGSSFAFLPALMSLVGGTVKYSTEWQNSMANVSIAIFIAGAVYVIISIIIKLVGIDKVKKLFPPIVVGPVIIIIGMVLAPKMFWNNIIGNYDTTYGWGAFMSPNVAVAWKQWTTAIITALTIILVNSLAKPKSFLKVVPILLGFIVGYLYALAIGMISYNGVFNSSNIVIFQNITKEFSFYKGFGNLTAGGVGTAILMIVPLAIVTFMEHIGDINANSSVCGKDFMLDPGINKTVMGDGIATMMAATLGGPANTTYGENTAVLAITQNYNPRNIFVAACLAVVFGIFTVFSDFLSTIPSAVIGGASIVLFGMISASGLRTLVEAKIDFNDSKNTIILSVVLAIGLGLGSMSLAGDITGYAGLKIMAGKVEISPLAIATFLGIILNLIIPSQKKISNQTLEAEKDTMVTLTSTINIIPDKGEDK